MTSPNNTAVVDEPGRTGTVLNSAYEIGALLGSGGMGYVYRAVQIATGREVAVKILRAQHVSNQTLVARFLREARAEALAKHPNIVDVIDAGLDERGTPFIVQELLTGEDLGQFLERAGGRLAPHEALRILLPAADGIAYAHAHGVVHRDLKPENVFLARGPGGEVVPKILDFGVSKIVTEPRSDDDGTKAGTILGTPEYMPPEQIQDGRSIDARADVWSLGIILYELLAGDIPFPDRGTRRIFVHVCLGEPTPLAEKAPGISPDLARIVDRCLRRDRDARYPTAAEFARDLSHVAAQRPVEPTRKLAALSLVAPSPRVVPSPREAAVTLDEGTPGGGSADASSSASTSATSPASAPSAAEDPVPNASASRLVSRVVVRVEPRGAVLRRRAVWALLAVAMVATLATVWLRFRG